jgi:hypothetical protein
MKIFLFYHSIINIDLIFSLLKNIRNPKVSKSNENEEIGVENDEFYSSFKKYKRKHLQKNKIKR